MALANYRQKRRFSVTPEPRGATTSESAAHSNTYVVQKHAASHLHYDFRLELDGALKSWAVPKGPSLDPEVKRLAVQVEDHPIEYAGFEGTIPQGEYGGGTVMVWDTGTWKPDGDPREELRNGSLRFELFGRKLRGGWHLTRMRNGAAGGKNWLLFKVNDEYARPAGRSDILDAEPLSAASGRSLEKIAAADSPVWQSNRKSGINAPSRFTRASSVHGGRNGANGKILHPNNPKKNFPAKPAPAAKSSPSRRAPTSPRGGGEIDPSRITGAVAAPMPRLIHPQLARYVDKTPGGDDWLHEIKLDGYRLIIHVSGNGARLITRQGNDWSHRFPELTAAMSRLPVHEAIFDGEVVMLTPDGKSSFQSLQNHLRDKSSGSLTLFLFDLIHCNGYDLTKAPLLERKTLLQTILTKEHDPHIRLSDHILGGGQNVYQQASRMGLEGVISKRVTAAYHQTRSGDWVKTKCLLRQEFIVLGYTAPTGSRSRFGSLLLGCHVDGELKYCGKVGTGFTQAMLGDVYKKLQPLIRPTPSARPPRGIPISRPTWVEPKLVVEVEFSQWTHDHRLRQPSFQGIREDKSSAEVVMEKAKSLGKIAPSERPMKKQAPSFSARGERVGVKGKPSNSKTRSASDTVSASEKRQSSSRIGSWIVEIAGVHITHPERVIYPDPSVSKLELAEYYQTVGDWVLPHVVRRPLSIVRCPQGVGHECFFQKHITENVPKHVRSLRVPEKDGEADYIAIDGLEGLIGLAQISALEIHPWGCREGQIEQPDRLIFDLDPGPGVAWLFVIETAIKLRKILQTLGLESFVKTTGGKGLHIVVPLLPRADWSQAKEFTRAIACGMARENPTRYIATMSKAKREGRIYVDYLRNGRGATAVAAYCTRARPGAAVSTPLRWEELGPKIAPDHFNVRNIPKRLATLKTDPWKDFFKIKQSLTESILGAVRLSGRRRG